MLYTSRVVLYSIIGYSDLRILNRNIKDKTEKKILTLVEVDTENSKIDRYRALQISVNVFCFFFVEN